MTTDTENQILDILKNWISDAKDDIKGLNESIQKLSEDMVSVKASIDSFKEDKISCKSLTNDHEKRIRVIEKEYIDKEFCADHSVDHEKRIRVIEKEQIPNERIEKIETKITWMMKNNYFAMAGFLTALWILSKAIPMLTKLI